MSLSINNNLMAEQTANNLNGHYSRLTMSTERLSSGLRINSAADDAAGLAIRELMRSDIAALNQGARNINDAISMLQTFEGALSVIDEKLIRMKELAEQAATGTYNSTQRLMIDSEFQAMGSEIDRIARATDFNGIKLLDGKWEGADGVATAAAMGRANPANPGDPAAPPELEIVNHKATGFSLAAVKAALANVDESKLGVGTYTFSFKNQDWVNVPNNPGLEIHFKSNGGAGSYNVVTEDPQTMWGVARTNWVITGAGGNAPAGTVAEPTNFPPQNVTSPIIIDIYHGNTSGASFTRGFSVNYTVTNDTDRFISTSASGGTVNDVTVNGNALTLDIDLGGGQSIKGDIAFGGDIDMARTASFSFTVREKAEPGPEEIPPDKVKIHFGTMNDSAEDYYYVKKHDATLKGLGLDETDIQTQQNAQEALVQIDEAMAVKDGIRAEYGAMQNRFENSLTNITIQAENLKAAESRISDADIAREMTEFVRSQVLTNSAVAMLAQANSMPQMVFRLIQ